MVPLLRYLALVMGENTVGEDINQISPDRGGVIYKEFKIKLSPPKGDLLYRVRTS